MVVVVVVAVDAPISDDIAGMGVKYAAVVAVNVGVATDALYQLDINAVDE